MLFNHLIILEKLNIGPTFSHLRKYLFLFHPVTRPFIECMEKITEENGFITRFTMGLLLKQHVIGKKLTLEKLNSKEIQNNNIHNITH